MTPPQSPHSSGEAAAPRSLSPEATSHLASPSDDPPSHDHFPDITPPPSPATQLPLRDFLCRMYPEIPAPLPAPPSPLPSPAATPRPDHFTPSVLVLDVRSPAEHTRGHIPGSHSLPLFDDAERAQVGLCFKHKGRLPAIELGLQLIGPKLAELAAYARRAGRRPGDPVLVYCWRGGMRSASVCWLLRLCGYECASLHGGYRAFRRWVQRLMHAPSAARGGGGARREAAVVPPVERHADEAIGEEAISRLIEEGGAADGAAQSFGEQFARARGLQAVGAGVGAAAAYLQAMRLGHPLRGHCLMMAGASLGQEKRHDEAVRCFHAAAEALAAHAPLHRQKHSLSHVHELRAQSLEALGQTAEAEAAARQAAGAVLRVPRSRGSRQSREAAWAGEWGESGRGKRDL